MVEEIVISDEEILSGSMVLRPLRNDCGLITDFHLKAGNYCLSGSTGIASQNGKDHLHRNQKTAGQKLFQIYKKAFETGIPCYMEIRSQNNGAEKLYHVTAQPQEEDLLVITSDITNVMKKYALAGENNMRYKNILDNSQECIARTDRDGNILYATGTLPDTGYQPSELTGKNIYDFLPQEERFSIADRHRKFLKNPSVSVFTHRFVQKNGEYSWMETSVKPITGEAGELREIQISGRNVTDRIHQQDKEKKEFELYKFIIENAGDILVQIDINGVYTFVSPSSYQLVGYKPEEMIGTSFTKYTHPGDLDIMNKALEEMIINPRVYAVTGRFITRSGKLRWMECTSTPLMNDKDEMTGILSCIRDISDRKGLEEKLSELNQALEQRVEERTRELEKKQNLLKLLTDSIPIQIIYLDTDLRIEYFNKTHYKWFGETAAINQGRRFDEIVKEYGLGNSVDMLYKSISGYQDFFEHAIKVDGEIRNLRSALIHNKDSEGNTIGYIAVSIDITREKSAQEKAEIANERFNALLNNAPLLFWTVNQEGIIRLTNGKALERLGFTSSEMVGESIFEITRDFPDIINHVRRALNGEYLNVTARFKNTYFQTIYSPITNSSGDPEGFAAFSTDITDIIEAENALKTSEAKYKSMAEGLPQLIWTATPEGSVDYFNQNWRRYTGQTEAESIGEGWKKAIHPDDKAKLSNWEESLKTGRQLDHEIRIKRHDAAYRWHLVRAWAARTETGKIIKWVGTFTDIQDQRIQNEELNVKNRELIRTNNDLDTFVYTASHDLRAPISNLEGLITAIEEEVSIQCENDIKPMVRMAGEAIHRLRQTISELTEISRIQRNIDEDVQQISISAVIDEFRHEFSTQIKDSNAEFLVRLQTEQIHFSKRHFRSIIYNLLSNAIKFRDQKRQLRIYIGTRITENNYVELIVKDNGIGFDMIHQDKVFSMFKRLHSHVEGTGVGMYIVKRIIENTGGRIQVESQPGAGTCFKILFRREE